MKNSKKLESVYTQTKDHRFSIKIYLDGGEKHCTDFYTEEGVRNFLRKYKPDTFIVLECELDENNQPTNYMNESYKF